MRISDWSSDVCSSDLRLARCRSGGEYEGKQQALDGNIAVARFLGDLFGLIEHTHAVIVETGCGLGSAAGHSGNFCQRGVGFAPGRGCVAPACLAYASRHPLVTLQPLLHLMFPSP